MAWLPMIVGFLAGALVLIAQITYIYHIFQKRLAPSVLSWLGWALLMGISAYSQIIDFGWNWSMLGLVLSVFGCIAISISGFIVGNYTLLKSDWYFLFAGMGCMILYVWFTDPWLTTWCAVIADLILGIPTLRNAIRNPHQEKTSAWTFGLLSWTLTLGLCVGESLLMWLFPVYLFLFNVLMAYYTRQSRINKKMLIPIK
ncbi:MAG: hypothetical protein ACJAY8_000466 [Sphingobacteriales bacterium]|jgi:hypothetical protein